MCKYHNLEYISDMKLQDNVRIRWTKRIYGFEYLTYSQTLKYLDLFSVEGRLPRAESSNVENYSTVNMGYVWRIYLFQLEAVLHVAIILELFMNVFHWIVGGGHLF